jgi:hypothetical protein
MIWNRNCVSFGLFPAKTFKRMLEEVSDSRFDDTVGGDGFHGTLTVWQVWAGIAASSDWHCAQIHRILELCSPQNMLAPER